MAGRVVHGSSMNATRKVTLSVHEFRQFIPHGTEGTEGPGFGFALAPFVPQVPCRGRPRWILYTWQLGVTGEEIQDKHTLILHKDQRQTCLSLPPWRDITFLPKNTSSDKKKTSGRESPPWLWRKSLSIDSPKLSNMQISLSKLSTTFAGKMCSTTWPRKILPKVLPYAA